MCCVTGPLACPPGPGQEGGEPCLAPSAARGSGEEGRPPRDASGEAAHTTPQQVAGHKIIMQGTIQV